MLVLGSRVDGTSQNPLGCKGNSGYERPPAHRFGIDTSKLANTDLDSIFPVDPTTGGTRRGPKYNLADVQALAERLKPKFWPNEWAVKIPGITQIRGGDACKKYHVCHVLLVTRQ